MLEHILREIYRLKLGSEFAREAHKREEIFITFILLDYFGIPNPLKLLSIECIPYLMEAFHSWHISKGIEKSPLDWLRCC